MAYNNQLDTFRREGCSQCCACTGGIPLFKQSLVMALLILSIIGIFVIAFSKRCHVCGHSMLLNEHHPDKK